MPLDWSSVESSYIALKLREDGDEVEQWGAKKYGLDTAFAEYQEFWRLHVAPATQRPIGPLNFNAGVHDEIINVIQSSYTVFAYLVEAHEYLRDVQNRLVGPRLRNWYNTIIYAGNAVQVFGQLQDSIEDATQAAGSKVTLFTASDWKTAWEPRRDSIINYRNYVTHQGKCQVFSDKADQYFVLKRSEVPARSSGGWIGWRHSDSDFKSNRSRFASIVNVAAETVAETTRWLNDAYRHINARLSTFPGMPSYRALWGWDFAGYTNRYAIVSPTKPVARVPDYGSAVIVGESGVRHVSLSATTAPPSSHTLPKSF